MNFRSGLFVALLSLSISACVGHFRYESRGTVVLTSSEQPSEALLYWYGDEGRLWYGKRYKQSDSGIEMRVCGATPKSFVPSGEGDAELQLLSRSGDRQVVEVDSTGDVVALREPKRLPPNSTCGRIAASGAEALTEYLAAGVEPQVFILCDNQQRPDRYPKPRRYLFEAVTKTEVVGNAEPEGC